jgi:hypothetical protein
MEVASAEPHSHTLKNTPALPIVSVREREREISALVSRAAGRCQRWNNSSSIFDS